MKNTFPCIFKLLDATCLPWLQHPSLSKYITPISSSRVTSALIQILTVSFLKDLCDYTEVTQDNPDNLSLSRSLTLIKSEAEPSRKKSALAKQAWERPSSIVTGGSALKTILL